MAIGSLLLADTIVSCRQQDKDKDALQGYHFIINVEKSRYVKEKSKIPISVSFNGGMQKYSGLLDLAMQANFVTKPSPGWYAKIDRKTGEVGPKVRLDATQTKEFWYPILEDKQFKTFVQEKYQIGYGNILNDETRTDDSKNLVYNEDFTRKVLPFIQSEYFSDSIERKVFTEIKEFVNRYGFMPTHDNL